MAEPFSIGTGVAGLIPLGIQVTEGLVKYYRSYKAQFSETSSTINRLESLLELFELLQKQIDSRKFRADEQDILKNLARWIQSCGELIVELQDEYKMFEKTSPDGLR